MRTRRCLILTLQALILFLALTACSSPEEKRDSFMDKGKRLEERGDYLRARLEFKNAVQVDPRCVDCYFSLAGVELALKNPQGAYDDYSRAIELAPGRLDIQLAFGKLLLVGRAPKKAEKKAHIVLAGEPDNIDAKILLALSLAFQKGKEKEALTVLKEIRDAAPGRSEGYVVAAKILSRQRNFTKAKELLRKGMEKSGEPHPFLRALLSVHVMEADWDSALKVAKQLGRLNKDDAGSSVILAQIYEHLGNTDLAKSAWQKALRKDPHNQRYILAFAKFWMRQGKPAEAESVLRNGITKGPAALDLHFALARLLALTGRETEALDLLKQISQKDITPAQRVAILNEEAKILFSFGKFGDCQATVSKILEKYPRDSSALLIQARLFMIHREGRSAVPVLRILLNDAPDNIEYRLLLAQAHLLNRDFMLAKDQLQRAIRKAPDDPRPWESMVRFYLVRKDLARAQSTLGEALKTNPGSAVLYDLQGKLQWLKGDMHAAEVSFRRAMELAPEWLAPYSHLVAVLTKSGMVDQAEKGLKNAIARHPHAENLKILLAIFYQRTGRPQSAISIYEKLLVRDPDNPLVCNNLAYLYAERSYNKGDIARAMELIKRVEVKFPGRPIILDTRAWVLFKSGDPKQALAILMQALAKDGDHPTILYHKGVILSALGYTNLARAVIKKLLEDQHMFPDREAAQQLLARLSSS